MSSCRCPNGKPKIGHLTKDEAITHRREHQKSTNHLIDVYKCPKCNLWHAGRKMATKEYRISIKKSAEMNILLED